MTDNPQLLAQLQYLSSGLLYISESDAPFETFLWQSITEESLTPELVRQLANYPPQTPVEVISADQFFALALRQEEWHDEEDTQVVKRYQALVAALKENLSQLQVYRVGKREIDIWIAGRTPGGNWGGLKTKVVET